MERRTVAEGEFHLIQCAVRSDGVTSPSATALELLEEGRFENVNSPKLPDLDQIDLVDEILVICEEFADTGVPPALPDINQLSYGVWEFRASWLRAAFYDTDGQGGYVAKTTRYSLTKNADWNEIPVFDPHIRLASCWGKAAKQANESDVKFTRQVRQEDLQHDKSSN